MKRILSVVPAELQTPRGRECLSRALPIEFIELSRGEIYGY
jgi:hypothetical protein